MFRLFQRVAGSLSCDIIMQVNLLQGPLFKDNTSRKPPLSIFPIVISILCRLRLTISIGRISNGGGFAGTIGNGTMAFQQSRPSNLRKLQIELPARYINITPD